MQEVKTCSDLHEKYGSRSADTFPINENFLGQFLYIHMCPGNQHNGYYIFAKLEIAISSDHAHLRGREKYGMNKLTLGAARGNPPSSTAKQNSSNSSEDSTDADDALASKMEQIRKFFEHRLHLLNSSPEPGDRVLDEPTLDGIVKYIKDKNVTKIITMAGAGISTSAGIPDFRSPKSGLYHNLEKYNLPHPQAIFELDFFKSNPEPFFVLAKELMPEGFKPTPSHYFIRLLHEKGLLVRHYTQNIDTLERLAGLPGEKLIEAHGTFNTGHCLECRAEYDLAWLKDKIKNSTVPTCEECKAGVVKPDIVFFGEMLPDRFHVKLAEDFPKAELLIIMGSSLVVQPFASLIDRVGSDCPRLLINKEKAGIADRISRFLGMGGGMDFDSNNGRDVAWLGDCDEGCQLFAEKLGWGDELKDLISKEHEKLDAEIKKSGTSTAKASRRSQSEKASNS
ncbi:hypothetical protein QAD02_005515 [Eretmocerus hayati]|uniref:Uncharacterized protein n=1 Tax=Eretmocerus hayati TaxID=131215 RepID=A0ACC2NTR5_9HYME|nr:hypothetical protein QAD02_005515 [Eretmocerus hayati]